MKVDMSSEAVTGRMKMLGQLWELAVSLKSSEIVDDSKVDTTSRKDTASNAKDINSGAAQTDIENDL